MLTVIIGNAPVHTDIRGTVDCADLVVRMNRCDHLGGNIGTRTDVLAITNTGPPPRDMLERRSPAFQAAFDSARWIMLPRNRLFNQIKAGQDETLAEVFADQSDYIATAAANAGKAILQAGLLESRALYRTLSRLQAWPFIMPSTGACVVEYFFRRAAPSDRFVLSGFLHVGWTGHPWAAERALFETYKFLPSLTVFE